VIHRDGAEHKCPCRTGLGQGLQFSGLASAPAPGIFAKSRVTFGSG
jgi:hypothetical protein